MRRFDANQSTLPGIPLKVPAAYRGKEFEYLLNGLHHWYEVQKIARMIKHDRIWVPASAKAYNEAQVRDLVARVASGRFIQAIKSPVDYSGVIRSTGRAVFFDAKQTKEKSLPLTNIKPHQLEEVLKWENAKAIAGFMIYFSDLGRFFFLWASYVEQVNTLALYGNGRKSISVAMCEEHGREIKLNRWNYPDWVAVLEPYQETKGV